MKPVRVKQVTDSSSNLNEGPFTIPAIDDSGYYLLSFGINGGVEIAARDKSGYENKGGSAFFSTEVDLLKAMSTYLSLKDLIALESFVSDTIISRQTSAEPADLDSKIKPAR